MNKELSAGFSNIFNISGVTDSIKGVLARHNIKVARKPFQILGYIFSKLQVKDPLQREQRADSFDSIPCKDCEHAYIGQSNNQFGTSLKEQHKAVFLYKKKNLAMSRLACQTNHAIGWNNSKLFTNSRQWDQRLFQSLQMAQYLCQRPFDP